jgi:hypothetical protein
VARMLCRAHAQPAVRAAHELHTVTSGVSVASRLAPMPGTSPSCSTDRRS